MATASDLKLFMALTDPFLKQCATTFGWGDLSEDTVMDVGCGRDLHCSRSILRNFPNVKSIIALDNVPEELEAITFKSPRIRPLHANILIWRDIRDHEGKIDKVISTRVLHQNPDKKLLFKQVHRLLKPGGDAAFLFTSDLGVYHVLKALSEDPKFKNFFKDSQVFTLYSRELKEKDYREMLEETRFQVINISKKRNLIPIDDLKKVNFASLYREVSKAFAVPPELVPEINEAAAVLYKKLLYDGARVYRGSDMSIFVTKSSDSGNGSSSD